MTETRAPADPPPPKPDSGAVRAAKAGGGRDERLAAALRANLARRKAQGRARAADRADGGQDPGADAADGGQNRRRTPRTEPKKSDERQEHGQHPRARRTPLNGAIPISGAKNACLDADAGGAAQRRAGDADNAPRLSDIRTMTALLECLGCEVATLQQGRVLVIGTEAIANHRADYEIVRKMRASILVLGPMLARDGHAVVSLPGGCAIGARPVDLHLRGLEALGAEIDLRDGYVHATAPARAQGRRLRVPAGLGRRHREPADGGDAGRAARPCSRTPRASPRSSTSPSACAAWARRSRARAPTTIEIRGRRPAARRHPPGGRRPDRARHLHARPRDHRRRGRALGGRRELVAAFADKLEEAGIEVAATNAGLQGPPRRTATSGAVDVTTAPFPGFPTDLQAQMMALLTLADGVSHLEERIFENRFMHAPELSAWARGSRCTAAPPPSPASSS